MNEPVSLTIGKLARLAARLFDRNLAGYGLRTSEFRFIGYMMEKGPVSHKDLQEEFRMTRATVSGLVSRLMAEGLVEAAASESDRRQWILTLSDKGRDLFSHAIGGIRKLDERIADALTEDEIEEFSRIGEKLIGLYEEELC